VADPIHIRPTAPLAERALLPGDPGRALALAQALFDAPPRMFNHHRGLWGYTGTALDGEALTVQSTGLGGPSAAIVLEELCALGLRRAVRVGTCTALDDGIELGDTIAVQHVLAADGTSRALGAGDGIDADRDLAAALARGAGHAGTVVSADLLHDDLRPGLRDGWAKAGALGLDMQTAALLAVAGRRGIEAGAILTVVARRGVRLGDEQAQAATAAAAAVALTALGLADAGAGRQDGAAVQA
jgi:uridine phosphorylase